MHVCVCVYVNLHTNTFRATIGSFPGVCTHIRIHVLIRILIYTNIHVRICIYIRVYIQGNNGFSHLVEEDYEWITEQLCKVAVRLVYTHGYIYAYTYICTWSERIVRALQSSGVVGFVLMESMLQCVG